MNKKGMTLIELLVYMAIAALLLAPVIMLMQNSSLNMARNAVNTDLRISGRDILNIMYEDIRNTGFKLMDQTGTEIERLHVTFMGVGGVNTTVTPPDTTWGVDDSSSFKHDDDVVGDKRYDTLTIRKGRLSSAGTWDGYDTIRYFVDAGKLTRNRDFWKWSGTAYLVAPESDSTSRKILTGNVEALQFQYSDSTLSEWKDTPPTDAYKASVRFIKIILVLRDSKKLAATNTTVVDKLANAVTITSTDKALLERHEIVVPIPNNGLFPD